jgi:hypothetical protein
VHAGGQIEPDQAIGRIRRDRDRLAIDRRRPSGEVVGVEPQAHRAIGAHLCCGGIGAGVLRDDLARARDDGCTLQRLARQVLRDER